MKIIMIGAPGTGKGTYASRLEKILGTPHISTGELCREEAAKGTELGKKIKEIMDRGGFQSDEIIMEMIKKRLKKEDCKNGFIFDGFPRTLKQAQELEKITTIDHVINLVVPDWILIKRLSLRISCKNCGEIYNLVYLKPKKEGICDKCGKKLIQRKDETSEGIKMRLKEYEKKTKPLIEYYKNKSILINISNNKIETPPKVVVDKILEILGVKK